ncbi:hypothetical protein ACOSQ2_019350 [Xanthoceras sorbifolium]
MDIKKKKLLLVLHIGSDFDLNQLGTVLANMVEQEIRASLSLMKLEGMDRTIITGSRNVPDGTTTTSNCTTGSLEPLCHLPLWLQRLPRYSLWLSLRQFYRDCHIYGTIDFIFDDASVRSMDHQANMITMQGRDHPKSNTRLSIIGFFALSTLYYSEYLNEGVGASTTNRVKWNGFRVLSNADEASPSIVSRFIHGDNWIPETSVPFSLGI